MDNELDDSGKLDLILDNQNAILENQSLILANQEDIRLKLEDLLNDGDGFGITEID